MATYIVRTGNGKNIVTEKDGPQPESMIGPGGYPAKIYKSENAAKKRARRHLNGIIEKL